MGHADITCAEPDDRRSSIWGIRYIPEYASIYRDPVDNTIMIMMQRPFHKLQHPTQDHVQWQLLDLALLSTWILIVTKILLAIGFDFSTTTKIPQYYSSCHKAKLGKITCTPRSYAR